MADFERTITNPDTGQKLVIRGPRQPSEPEIREIFKRFNQRKEAAPPVEQPQPQAAPTGQPRTAAQNVLGFLETLGTLASGAIAEPVAGIAGLATQLNPAREPGAGAEVVEQFREGLTFQPRTEAGQEILGAVGETLEPVAKAFKAGETTLGDKAFELTGSPAVAALATTIPAALTELVGFGIGKRFARATPTKKTIAKEIKDTTPSLEDIKAGARKIYKEVDDLGVVVKAPRYDFFVKNLGDELAKEGFDSRNFPKSATALSRLQEELGGTGIKLQKVLTLRKVAQSAAKSIDPEDARWGNIILDSVDEFVDKIDVKALNGNIENVGNVGARLKVARELWRRNKQTEVLNEAVFKAELQPSGVENGLRRQFAAILRDPKKRRFLGDKEQAAMRRVIKGTKGANLAKLLGSLGISEGQGSNTVRVLMGIFSGGVAGGAEGAMLVPAIGTVSRGLAERLTKRNANFANQVIRAGKDAEKITKAYLRNTPKALRSPEELSQLLMKTSVDLSKVPESQLARTAAEIATERRGALLGAAGAGAAVPEEVDAEMTLNISPGN